MHPIPVSLYSQAELALQARMASIPHSLRDLLVALVYTYNIIAQIMSHPEIQNVSTPGSPHGGEEVHFLEH
jgi:hypothetical protein